LDCFISCSSYFLKLQSICPATTRTDYLPGIRVYSKEGSQEEAQSTEEEREEQQVKSKLSGIDIAR
jgi:hypothetical protein